MTRPHPKLVQRLLEKALNDLPPLPEALTNVLIESQRADVSAHSLESVIGKDQAITAKVLRVVNSAYYGLPGRVQSLGQACVILGVSQIRNLALTMAALCNVEATTQAQRDTQMRFWKHAFGTASAAQWIVRRANSGPQEEDLAFVGGLLHDIGRLFLYSNMPDVYQLALENAVKKGIQMHVSELEIAGINHPAIGSRMARKWNLPEPVCEAIEHHAGPQGESERPANFAIHIGDCVNEYLYNDDADFVVPACSPIAYEWFGADEADWAAMMSHAAEKVDAASRCFAAAA